MAAHRLNVMATSRDNLRRTAVSSDRGETLADDRGDVHHGQRTNGCSRHNESPPRPRPEDRTKIRQFLGAPRQSGRSGRDRRTTPFSRASLASPDLVGRSRPALRSLAMTADDAHPPRAATCRSGFVGDRHALGDAGVCEPDSVCRQRTPTLGPSTPADCRSACGPRAHARPRASNATTAADHRNRRERLRPDASRLGTRCPLGFRSPPRRDTDDIAGLVDDARNGCRQLLRPSPDQTTV